MDEHLDVRQVAEFILDGLDDNELAAVCRHFDEESSARSGTVACILDRGGAALSTSARPS